MGKREEYLRDAVHGGTGPDGREYKWRAADMGISAEALKVAPHVLVRPDPVRSENSEVKAPDPVSGDQTVQLMFATHDSNNVFLLRCVISPRLIEDEADPDPDAVLLWTLRKDVRTWLLDQIQTSSNLKGAEVDQARSFRGEPAELPTPGIAGEGEPHEAVGSVSG